LAVKEGGITSLSSNFRTFGSTNTKNPDHRISGIKMTKPNGVEFRIFDHFSDFFVKNIVNFVALVAENSRVTQTKGYVYENKQWIHAVQNIMKHGYKAQLTKEYIELLREKLGLPIHTTSIIAHDVFTTINDELWEKNKDGKWTMILNRYYKPLRFSTPEINKNSWQFALAIMLNREEKLMEKMNELIDYVNTLDIISFFDLQKQVKRILGKKWEKDADDLVYFLDEKIYKLHLYHKKFYKN
jgi:hypothetical protein